MVVNKSAIELQATRHNSIYSYSPKEEKAKTATQIERKGGEGMVEAAAFLIATAEPITEQ